VSFDVLVAMFLCCRFFLDLQNVFADLLDSLILDVASEAHRAARLGFDYRLRNEEEDEARTCAGARATLGDVDSAASENSGKYTVDVFEQTHPSIAQEMFDCMNCGRPIVAGRFAPHLEKCMGKVSIDLSRCFPFSFAKKFIFGLLINLTAGGPNFCTMTQF